jgi:1,6-anhydro-N-acetylmuramate kinase
MKIIGTMSGTSCDGLDIAFCEFDNHYKETRLVKYMPAFYEFDTDLREKLKPMRMFISPKNTPN